MRIAMFGIAVQRKTHLPAVSILPILRLPLVLGSLLVLLWVLSPRYAAAAPPTVFVPLEQLEKATRLDHAGPAPISVAEARYTARRDSALLRIKAHVRLEVSRRGWWELVLFPHGLALESISSEAVRVHARENAICAGVTGPGSFAAELTFVVPVTTVNGRSMARVPLVPCPMARFSFLLPDTALAWQLDPLLAATTKETAGGLTIEAYVGSLSSIGLSWQPHHTAEAIFRAACDALLEIHPGFQRLRLDVDCEILRGALPELAVRIPGGWEPRAVRGVDVASWETRDGTVVAQFREPAEDTGSVGFDLERVGAVEVISAPSVEILGAARQWGRLVIGAPAMLRLDVERFTGVSRIDVPPHVDANTRTGSQHRAGAVTPAFAFRFFDADYALEVNVQKRKPAVSVTSRALVVLGEQRICFTAAFTATVSDAPIYRLHLGLPAGVTVTEVSSTSAVVGTHGIEHGDNATDLQIDLATGETDSFDLRVSGCAVRDETEALVRVQVPYIKDARRHRGYVMVAGPQWWRLEAQRPPAFTPIPAGECPVPENSPIPDVTLALAYAYAGIPEAFTVAVERRTPRITAQALTHVDVMDDLLRVTYTFDTRAEFAGADTFSFRVPARIADSIRVQSSDLKEVKRSPQQLDLTLREKKQGVQRLSLTHEEELSLNKEGSGEIRLPRVDVLHAHRIEGYVSVNPGLTLAVEPKAEKLEIIDTAEIPAPLRPSEAIFAWRHVEPFELSLSVKRLSFVPAVTSAVPHLVVRHVVTPEFATKSECILDCAGAGGQFLKINLPHGSRVRGVWINGENIGISTTSKNEEFLVNVGHQATQGGCPVCVRYDTPGRAVGFGSYGSLKLVTPTFSMNDAPVPVGQLFWELYLPPEFRYVQDGGTVLPIAEEPRPWLQRWLLPNELGSTIVATRQRALTLIRQAEDPARHGLSLPTEGLRRIAFWRLAGEGSVVLRYVSHRTFLTGAMGLLLLLLLAGGIAAKAGGGVLGVATTFALLGLGSSVILLHDLRHIATVFWLAGAIILVIGTVRGALRLIENRGAPSLRVGESEQRIHSWHRPDAPGPSSIIECELRPDPISAKRRST